MGRGNVYTSGKYEGLFYIDNYSFHVYRKDDQYAEDPETRLMGELDYAELTGGDWLYDELGTSEELDDILECFIEDFTQMFPSFERCGQNVWLRNGCNDRRAILESKLFYVAIEDNEWSIAVELVQKEEPWGMIWMENLQKRLHERYLDGIKLCLLKRLPSIATRTSAWTSGRIKRDEVMV